MPLERALRVFLHQTDVRANIVERPTTAQNVNILTSVLHKLDQSFEGDRSLYERERFRGTMKELNLQGGTKLLEILEAREVDKIINKCIARV
jgi:ribulose kinase